MPNLNRRSFLQQSAATVASLSALTAAGAADRPNEKVVLAVMGVRSRGRQLINGLAAQPDVEFAYVCDVDENVVAPAISDATKRQKRTPKVEKDVRRALEDKEVTALVIAAPDHWHALATVWACQAGKHVYVEKPISHNVIEGRRMVEAARKYDRVVQVGTQRRSAPHARTAAEFVRSGKLGKIPFIRTWIAGGRPSIGRKTDGPVPAGVDYDLWLGPAPKRPFNPNRFHYEWHWFWDYGTGELGNNGIHALDMARAILPGLDDPVRVHSGGGKYFYDDDRETPDTQIATFDYPNTSLVWEHRFWSKTGIEGLSWGVWFYGEKGVLQFDDRGWRVADGVEAGDKPGEYNAAHLRNFLDCVKSGKRPNADIEQGHQSTRLCHLGNLAYRTGKTLKFNARTETLDDEEANKLLGRTYRPPFVVPERI